MGWTRHSSVGPKDYGLLLGTERQVVHGRQECGVITSVVRRSRSCRVAIAITAGGGEAGTSSRAGGVGGVAIYSRMASSRRGICSTRSGILAIRRASSGRVRLRSGIGSGSRIASTIGWTA